MKCAQFLIMIYFNKTYDDRLNRTIYRGEPRNDDMDTHV